MNDMSISGIHVGQSTSLPSSPRGTGYSWTQSLDQTLGRTVWGTTANWIDFDKNCSKTALCGFGFPVPEDDLWEELEECADFADNDDQTSEDVRVGKRRRPIAPKGMPPLPVSTATGFNNTSFASTTANPFGAGVWPSESGAPAALEGHFGRFAIGTPLPTFVGGGAFGRKFTALDLNLHRRVLVWHYEAAADEVAVTDRPRIKDAVATEVERLQHIRHARLCPYLASERLDGELYIILGYAPGGSVSDWLHDAGPMGEAPTQRVMGAALEGLAFLHDEMEIVHGAIHGGNVLLGPGAAVRLADFGLSPVRSASSERRRLAARSTLAEMAPKASAGSSPLLRAALWLAPELSDDGPITRSSDVWALGRLAVEMLCGCTS